MKIRNGFVSNSSSSSFLIYGAELESSEINRLLRSKAENDQLSAQRAELEAQLEQAQTQYKQYQSEFLALENKNSEVGQALAAGIRGAAALVSKFERAIDKLDDEIDDDSDTYSLVENALEGSSLEFHCPGDYNYYVGISWDEVGDDETGRQFRQRVEAELKRVFGTDLKCGTHQEAWYNG